MSMRSSASQMTRAAVRPDSFGALQSAIARHYDGLSKRLQQVAEYALTHPDDVALETIAVIAGRARVPPSSLIRFAKALGFEGFTDMQRLFRARLIERSPDYGERIRSMRDRHAKDGTATPALVLDEFATACVEALERLRQEVPNEKMAQAVEAMATADGIYIAAQRRAFPVAIYLRYLLGQLERRAYLLDDIGGMFEQQARGMRKGDVLLAVSFRPYAPEVVTLVEQCHDAGVPVIAITDSPLSPLIRFAHVGFEVVEAEVQAFRSLSASMCLALTLMVALGHRLDASAAD